MKRSKLALCFAVLSSALYAPVYGRGGPAGGGHPGGGGGRSIGSAGGSFRGGASGAFRGAGGTAFRGGTPGSFRGAPYYNRGRYYRTPSLYLRFGYPYYGYYGYGASYYGYDPYFYDFYGDDPYASPSYSVPPDQNYGYPYPPSNGYPPPAPQYQFQPQSGAGSGQTDNYYLIAFKDHTIEPATTYKIDGDQIHWITREGQERQASLSAVDVELTQKLNGGRPIDVQRP
jgi:hypothetical protein